FTLFFCPVYWSFIQDPFLYEELCRGVVEDSSKHAYLKIMDELVRKGAQAIVLGCTEIGLLVGEEDTKIPLYDTARLHADAAVKWTLE
ncbi:MAG: aspartate/glutamate racemase family protein, partial [bacterium]|nr:aspartate/glutamate racemase family protein [bacterium]